MKKSLIFKILYLFLGLVVMAGASVFATNTFLANQVTYGNTNVETALNNLFIQNNKQNYSTDEQVIGKWINNKPIYRKVFIGKTPNTTTSNVTTSILVSDKLDELLSLKWTLIPTTNYKLTGEGVGYPTTDSIYGAWLTDNNYIRVRVGSPNYCDILVKYIVEYTKTTN